MPHQQTLCEKDAHPFPLFVGALPRHGDASLSADDRFHERVVAPFAYHQIIPGDRLLEVADMPMQAHVGQTGDLPAHRFDHAFFHEGAANDIERVLFLQGGSPYGAVDEAMTVPSAAYRDKDPLFPLSRDRVGCGAPSLADIAGVNDGA